jgi:hypothetical protein
MVAVGGQWTTNVAIPVARGPVATGGPVVKGPVTTVRDSRAVATFPPSVRDYSDRAILLGRIKSGLALESRRVVHVFELTPDLPDAATTLTSSCGENLLVEDLQWLPRLAGMPCEECVVHSVRNAG